MKTLAVINTHSFVDLITNSSSELFVCDTDKSIQMVKEVVEKIVNNYYDELGYETGRDIWGDIFLEPYICKIDFNLNDYPNREDVRMINEWNYFDDVYKQVDTEVRKKYPQPDHYSGLNYEERREDKDCKKWDDDYNNLRMKLLKERVWDKRDEAEQRILDFFKITEDDEKGFEDQCDFHGYGTFIHYNIKAKKGDIILVSASDNTVPYETWDRINNVLNAQNYHLG